MITVRRQGGIIQIHDKRITRLSEDVSKTKYCIKNEENRKKKVLKFCPKSKKNAKIPLRVRVEYVAISVFFGNAWKIF